MEQCPVIATDIVRSFNLARRIILRLMRLTDGIRCQPVTSYGIDSTGQPGKVKHFSVLFLPDIYQLTDNCYRQRKAIQ